MELNNTLTPKQQEQIVNMIINGTVEDWILALTIVDSVPKSGIYINIKINKTHLQSFQLFIREQVMPWKTVILNNLKPWGKIDPRWSFVMKNKDLILRLSHY